MAVGDARSSSVRPAQLKRSGHLSILMTSSTSISYVAGYVLFSIFWLGPPTGVTILTNVDCGKKLEGILQQIGEGKLRMPQVAERLPPDRIAKARALGGRRRKSEPRHDGHVGHARAACLKLLMPVFCAVSRFLPGP